MNVSKEYMNKVSAFLNKNNFFTNKTPEEAYRVEHEYYEKYTEEEFDKLIKEHYAIKGEVTAIKIANAKKIKQNAMQHLNEHDIQSEVCKYLDSKKIKYWAVTNGFVHNGDKVSTAKYINYLKQEGYKNGVFDITILLGNGNVAFLELKTLKGKPSEYQLKWKKYFDENGYISAICKGYDEAVKWIEEKLEKIYWNK